MSTENTAEKLYIIYMTLFCLYLNTISLDSRKYISVLLHDNIVSKKKNTLLSLHALVNVCLRLDFTFAWKILIRVGCCGTQKYHKLQQLILCLKGGFYIVYYDYYYLYLYTNRDVTFRRVAQEYKRSYDRNFMTIIYLYISLVFVLLYKLN